MKSKVFVLLDKHEGCVGESYHEYLMRKDVYDALPKTKEQFVNMSSTDYADVYQEHGMKKGYVNIMKDESGKVTEFFTFEHDADDSEFEDGMLSPDSDEVVVEVVRTINSLVADTRLSVTGMKEVDFSLDYDEYAKADMEDEYVDAMLEHLVYEISPMRSLMSAFSFDEECLLDVFEDCSEFNRAFDECFDTLEVYVRDSSGNRNKVILQS